MPRKPAKQASKQLKTTNALGSQYNTQANNLYSSLEPQLQAEATNPQGFGTQDLNAMRTGARQAVGGSTAGITGQANQAVARTRNSAGYNSTLDSAAQSADQTNSQDELGIEAANAQLKQQQQQQALSSLGGLYNTGVGASEGFYGQGVPAINAETNASPGWVQSMDETLSSLGGLGKGVGAAASGFG